MVNRLTLIIVLWMLWASQGWAQLTASVDRTQMLDNETLELTVTGEHQFNLKQPDFSALENDFSILDVRQSRRIIFTNGKDDSATSWILTLQPKRSGKLVIPAFDFAGSKSEPITVTVNQDSGAISGQEPVFVEAEVDKQRVHVQEQLLYTVRVFYSGRLHSGELSAPDMPNVVIQQLGDQRNFQRLVNGVRYQVVERKYALFPQASGPLYIEEARFNGSLIDRRRNRRFYQETGPDFNIKVLPPEPGFPGDTWLPAMGLTLFEQWSEPPATLSVGDTLTRTITVKALGLTGSQLPPLSIREQPKLKQYPDQPEINDEQNAAGITGSRVETLAIVATEPGDVVLPEIQIPWWDTVNQKLQFAVIPEKRIRIEGAAAASTAPTTTATPLNSTVGDDGLTPPLAPVWWQNTWFWVSLVLLFGWGATLLSLRQRRVATPVRHSSTPAPVNSGQALKALERACRQNHTRELASHLLHWARAHWPGDSFNHLYQVADKARSDELREWIKRVERAQYGPAGDGGQPDWLPLYTLVADIDRKHHQREALTQVQALYPH